eukprot:snap_masked-scaffold_104-processed-gene-0.5-mRNA-1 protein AED:1.00 eAED:1.00 QI:0/0/0/0/1/1/3/0/59
MTLRFIIFSFYQFLTSLYLLEKVITEGTSQKRSWDKFTKTRLTWAPYVTSLESNEAIKI